MSDFDEGIPPMHSVIYPPEALDRALEVTECMYRAGKLDDAQYLERVGNFRRAGGMLPVEREIARRETRSAPAVPTIDPLFAALLKADVDRLMNPKPVQPANHVDSPRETLTKLFAQFGLQY